MGELVAALLERLFERTQPLPTGMVERMIAAKGLAEDDRPGVLV